ncbi:MAG TPA: MarR family winged helix-turn-helix transcriptional regulator [Acidobacteriaceae bacterium]|jgi:DNA-binding MarR family transcriptional regulator|nr:MarR family winged helix-turn-helix transcriptional regulator [Acidobacteriaceae bacterium]
MSSAKRKQLLPALNRAVRLFIAGSGLYSQRVAEKLSLHPTDMQFLNLLDLLGPVTPGMLAQCSGLSSGGVTVVLDRLEKAGYVRRSSNPDDRRSVLVGLVAARQKRVTANYESIQSQFESMLVGFSDEELETILKFFASANTTRPPNS